MPDTEIFTRTFPNISITLLGIEPDPERTFRAMSPIQPYDTEEATPPVGTELVAFDYPLPWIMIYQIATFARDFYHDRQLGAIMYQLFPNQYGFLDMTGFDGTVRRADLISSTRRDMYDVNNKRVFNQIFTIGVSSEFYLGQLQAIQKIASFNVSLNFTGQIT